MDLRLVSDYQPKGDQVHAIGELNRGIYAGEKHQVLLGVTGSGKTYTMAKVIEQLNRPALVLAHNKTLAAQLYHEFKQFFPNNAVEYFVSYYDYYQPEAYIPAGDVYIEKEATINDELDKLRLSATRSLFERRDCIIVASVSCIYGLGSPEAYYGMLLLLEKGQRIRRNEIFSKLVDILYERNDTDFKRGTFRVRGDVIEVFPTYDDNAYRIELFGDEVDSLSQIDPLFGTVKQKYSRLPIYPKSHYVMSAAQKSRAMETILEELAWWEKELEKEGRLVESQRVHQRTRFDLEMIKSVGYCHGIENYSRHFSGVRTPRVVEQTRRIAWSVSRFHRRTVSVPLDTPSMPLCGLNASRRAGDPGRCCSVFAPACSYPASPRCHRSTVTKHGSCRRHVKWWRAAIFCRFVFRTRHATRSRLACQISE